MLKCCRLLPFIILLCLSSCIEQPKTIDAIWCSQTFPGSGIDSSEVQIIYKYNSSELYYRLIENDEPQDTAVFDFSDTTMFGISKKELSVKGKIFEITRVENKNREIADGDFYLFLLKDGRPILNYGRSWLNLDYYLTSQDDMNLFETIISDTSCFFKCPNPPEPHRPILN